MNASIVPNLRERISTFDRRALEWLSERHGTRLTRGMRAVTELGSFLVVTAIAGGTAWTLFAHNRRRAALLVASAAAGAGVLSETLKRVFGRERPDVTGRLVKTVGFAFPSGHATASAATYGALALFFAGKNRRLLAGALTLVPGLVGVSRVVLRVHYPSDVVAGWALGTSWLMFVRWIAGSPSSR